MDGLLGALYYAGLPKPFKVLLACLSLNAMPQDPQKSLVNDHQKAVISQGVAKNAEISS
jgi:hypothetical protein